MPTPTSVNVIEELIVAVYGATPEPRKQYFLLQALHGLVRLAKTEQLREVKTSVGKAVGAASTSSRRETQALLRRMGINANGRQGKFEFDKEDSASSE